MDDGETAQFDPTGGPVRRIRGRLLALLTANVAMGFALAGWYEAEVRVLPVNSARVLELRILETEAFYKISSPLAIALGRDVSGQPVVADLARMPHLLIAGTTGSGKSVCIAAMTACLVMNNTPQDLRLVMIDPTQEEVSVEKVVPSLAERWTISPDGKVYTFYLRKGVKFHNGREMTAEDIKWNFDRILDPKTGSSYKGQFDMLDSVRVVDRYTVKLIMNKPWRIFVSTIECGVMKRTLLSLLATVFVRSFLTPRATDGPSTMRKSLFRKGLTQNGASSVTGVSTNSRLYKRWRMKSLLKTLIVSLLPFSGPISPGSSGLESRWAIPEFRAGRSPGDSACP
jgi:hypothetical protein